MQLKQHIPNAITSLNLVCGVLALLAIGQGESLTAAYLVGAALAFDFLDGFVARALGVHSDIGKELDSLADAVTFGVVPGFIMMRLIRESQTLPFPMSPDLTAFTDGTPMFLAALLIPVFSILRLAKFNLDTRQSDAFYGLATPASTLLILSFWLIVDRQGDSWLAQSLNHAFVWVGLCVIIAYLLIADIRLIAFKFKEYGFAANRYRYILMISSIILLALFQYMAVPFLILLYFLLSALQNLSEKPKA